ncbi:hypothetical protein [Actinobaculum sp. 313]|uniref:hypothetical protein n=1 Tax=Actinobaculum sp. 313 TaxID=2495645 RepID=UPI000D529397|nr:hypothetical protein [Actinobaculum sp. 313]AWE42977.1 hypothetical protein DDD63_09775 [Actinobaculum sp. 313]
MRIELPDSWQEKPATGIFDGAAYVALGPAGYRDYAPSVVVLRVEDMQDSLGQWTSRSRNDIPSDIATYRLLDIGELTLAGNPATVSMTVLSISGVSVTQTQVLTITPRGDGYQITASCATPDYPKLVDLLHSIIATFNPEEDPLGADEEPATAYVHSFPGRRLPSSWREQHRPATPGTAKRNVPAPQPGQRSSERTGTTQNRSKAPAANASVPEPPTDTAAPEQSAGGSVSATTSTAAPEETPAATPGVMPPAGPDDDHNPHNVAPSSGAATNGGMPAPPEQADMHREEPGAATGRTATPGEDA